MNNAQRHGWPRLLSIMVGLLLALVIGLSTVLVLPSPAQATVREAPSLVVVAGKIKIKPGTKEEFTQLAEKCLILSRQEPGSVSYSFYEDQTAPNTILYFEEWRNQAALDHHFQTPYFQEFMEKAGPLFNGTPEIKVYSVAETKTL
ncbi:hypothetical protein Syn6312_2126 [Synechococcus sp. PCC 6312]|nr:hypothetical protein Syn6312_2126 [Synechococcus sp. PCC 6312]